MGKKCGYDMLLIDLQKKINKIEDKEIDYQKNKKWIKYRKQQEFIYQKKRQENEMEI